MCPPLTSSNNQPGGDHEGHLIPPGATAEGIEALASLPRSDRIRTSASSPGCSAQRRGRNVLTPYRAFKAPSVFITMDQRPSCQYASMGPPSVSPRLSLNLENVVFGAALRSRVRLLINPWGGGWMALSQLGGLGGWGWGDTATGAPSQGHPCRPSR